MKKQPEYINEYLPLETIAEIAGATPRWINALVKSGVIPRPQKEGFPARSTISALFRRKESSDIQKEKLLKLAAERKQAERAERIAGKLERGEYTPTDEVVDILQTGINAFELVPSKMASEFGWPPPQEKRLQQLLDEAREVWAKKIAEMPDLAPEI